MKTAVLILEVLRPAQFSPWSATLAHVDIAQSARAMSYYFCPCLLAISRYCSWRTFFF